MKQQKTSHPGFELSRAPASETLFSLFCHWTIKAVEVKISIEGTNLLLLFKMFIELLQYYLMTQSQWVH